MFHYVKDKLGLTKVEKPAQMPAGEHWAIHIFETTSTYVEGDERSRTHPGHGYPGHYDTHNSFRYWACRDKQAMEDALEYMRVEQERHSYREKKPYAVIRVHPAAVRTTIKVEVT